MESMPTGLTELPHNKKDPGESPETKPLRPLSIILLAAIFTMLLLGLSYYYIRKSPDKLAYYLIAQFVFFFLVTILAIDDAVKLYDHYIERKRVIYKDTVGEESFRNELERREAEAKREKLSKDKNERPTC